MYLRVYTPKNLVSYIVVFFNLPILRHGAIWTYNLQQLYRQRLWSTAGFTYRRSRWKKKCGWRWRETVLIAQSHAFVFVLKFDFWCPVRRRGICDQNTPRVCCCLVCLAETLAPSDLQLYHQVCYLIFPQNKTCWYNFPPKTCWYNFLRQNVD